MNNLRPLRLLLLLMTALLLAVVAAQPPIATGGERGVSTPPPGSVERRAILDAMRQKVKELHELDVVFVVREMRVSGGWAWVHTLPQSRDGLFRYEDFFALLRKMDGLWMVAEIPCTEPENPECIDHPDFFERLRERFPAMPPSLIAASTAER